jgi:DNA-binding response OmpR family regulator
VSEQRVLVVDDEPAIRALVTKIVERAGLPVDNARDGAEAIAKLDSEPYAVLVLDLMMPGVDGFAVIDHLRGHQLRPAIIVITAGDTAAIRRLDGAMVHSVLRKPFDIDVLGDLIVAAARTIAAEQKVRDAHASVIPFPKPAKP